MIGQHPLHSNSLEAEALDFYRGAIRRFTEARLPFLVGGAYALRNYAGISRETKDFDIFVLPADAERALGLLAGISDRTDMKYPHWLGKAHRGDYVVDVIFGSGNGLCPVDRQWFENSRSHTVCGEAVELVPPEEMIWQKAFIMERHRFDGGDVIHLLRECGETLDCERLVSRFGINWPVLLVHLILWRFAYPTHRAPALEGMLAGLVARVAESPATPDEAWVDGMPVCRGPLLSLLDYLPAVQTGGYRDARLPPTGRLSAADIAHWTATFEW